MYGQCPGSSHAFTVEFSSWFVQFYGLIFKIQELSTQISVRYFGSNGEPVYFIPICIFRNFDFV